MKLAINLATKSYPNRRALTAGGTLLLLLLGVFLVNNLIGLTAENNRTKQLIERFAALEESSGQTAAQAPVVAQISYSAEALVQQRQRIIVANRLLEEDAFRWTALLDRLEAILPEGVSLSSITPHLKDGVINISGESRDVPTLQVLLDRLLGSEFFFDVRLASQSRVKGGKGQSEATQVQFNLSMIWKEIL